MLEGYARAAEGEARQIRRVFQYHQANTRIGDRMRTAKSHPSRALATDSVNASCTGCKWKSRPNDAAAECNSAIDRNARTDPFEVSMMKN